MMNVYKLINQNKCLRLCVIFLCDKLIIHYHFIYIDNGFIIFNDYFILSLYAIFILYIIVLKLKLWHIFVIYSYWLRYAIYR